MDKGVAVTVTHAQAGSPATMGLYNTLDCKYPPTLLDTCIHLTNVIIQVLDPSQDWLFNHTTGRILSYCEYYTGQCNVSNL